MQQESTNTSLEKGKHHLQSPLRSYTSMASKVRVQSYIANPPLTTCSNVLKKSQRVRTVISTHLLSFKNTSIHWNSTSDSKPFFTIRAAAEHNADVSSEAEVAADAIKSDLYQAIQGINRGIFGITSEKKIEIERLVTLLESKNPTVAPTADIHKLVGSWKLLFSTISILGSKRTKLGLRNFISLGDLYQTIDATQGKAISLIKFSVKGLNLLNGQLEIVASYKISSASRVSISYESSIITPDQLMNVFKDKHHTLLEIFNPEGWLEITYVDDELRIGRDNKGNIFVLERLLQDL